MIDLLLRQVRIADHQPLQDIAIRGDQIVAMGTNLSLAAETDWDLAGQVVLPGLVDLHTHLDKTYSIIHNQSGTLLEAIEVWGQHAQPRSPNEAYDAAARALRDAIQHGVTAIRSHVNVGRERNFPIIEALLRLRADMKATIDIQFVALGQVGFSDEADAAMETALEMGIDYIGGAPSLTPDPHQAIDAAIALALKTGKPLDMHIDETEDPQMCCLDYLAEQTLVHDLQGRVTAGHCCSLGFIEPDRAAQIIDKVAAAEITIVTLPSCNLVLMGRGIHPAPRGITPVKALLSRGVKVCAASDNVQDPFNPFGCYDLLQIANLNAHVAHLTGEPELYTSLAMVSDYPAWAFGKGDAKLREGSAADLCVLKAERCLDAVLAPPQRLATIKAGKIICRTHFEQTWSL